VGDRPGRQQANANHEPELGLYELALITPLRIAGVHPAPELRIIPVERLLNLLQLALLVFWERHDAPPKREPCAENIFGNCLIPVRFLRG